jgi:hypothetical protein
MPHNYQWKQPQEHAGPCPVLHSLPALVADVLPRTDPVPDMQSQHYDTEKFQLPPLKIPWIEIPVWLPAVPRRQ